jgi:hypothetical protein
MAWADPYATNHWRISMALDLKRTTVLVVEDTAMMRKIEMKALKGLGC